MNVQPTTLRDSEMALQGKPLAPGIARPLKSVIQRELETPISRKIIAGEIKEESSVKAKEKNGELEFVIK